MLEFLPTDVCEGLLAGRLRATRGRSRLRIAVGDALFPVLRVTEESLVLDAGQVAHLRGLVDLYDGARHLTRCLIVASEAENGELVCAFKRATRVTDRAALDYWQDEHGPVAALRLTRL